MKCVKLKGKHLLKEGFRRKLARLFPSLFGLPIQLAVTTSTHNMKTNKILKRLSQLEHHLLIESFMVIPLMTLSLIFSIGI